MKPCIETIFKNNYCLKFYLKRSIDFNIRPITQDSKLKNDGQDLYGPDPELKKALKDLEKEEEKKKEKSKAFLERKNQRRRESGQFGQKRRQFHQGYQYQSKQYQARPKKAPNAFKRKNQA